MISKDGVTVVLIKCSNVLNSFVQYHAVMQARVIGQLSVAAIFNGIEFKSGYFAVDIHSVTW